MIHHYPPIASIPQQVIPIPSSLYSHSPQGHAPHLPPTASASYLPSATSIYTSLLQPLSIQLIQSTAHAPHIHQHQPPTSTFGLTHVYPPQPLLILTQSLPSAHPRPAHIILPAPSRHSLHEFCTQSEMVLNCGRGRIELTEYGERCCVRDLDGNLIEVQWASHHSGRSIRHTNSDAFTRRSDLNRDVERNHLSYREQDSERLRGKEKGVRVQREDRRTRQDSNNKLSHSHNLSFDAGKKPNTKARRVLQWQKDVAQSLNYRDDDYRTEESENSEEYISSEDEEHSLIYTRSYTHSQTDYHVYPKRNKLLAPYQENYDIKNDYRTSAYVGNNNNKYRNLIRRQTDMNYMDSRESQFDKLSKRDHENVSQRARSKHRVDSFARSKVTTRVALRRASSNFDSSTSTRANFTCQNHIAPRPTSNFSAKYYSRTKGVRRAESDNFVLTSSGRRDSGIGGIGGFSCGEKDRGDFDKHPAHRHKGEPSIKSQTLKARKSSNLPRTISESNYPTIVYENSRGRKGKERDRRSKHKFRPENSSYNSLTEYDTEDYETHSSRSEFYGKPESSRKAKERQEEKRRKWNEYQDRARDIYREQVGRELEGRGRQKPRSRHNSHYSPVRSAAHRYPSSVSRSTKRGRRPILARVPKPPSAVPLHSRKKSEIYKSGNHENPDENSDFFEDVDDEYNAARTVNQSRRGKSSRHTPSHSYYSSQRRSVGSISYDSRGKREGPLSYDRARYENENSVVYESASSFDFERKRGKEKLRRRKSSMRH